MSDLNVSLLEGVIHGKFFIQRNSDIKAISAINFTVLSRPPSGGKDLPYEVVAWRVDPDKFVENLHEGDYIRISGHLQSTPALLEGGKQVCLSKVCADSVELLSAGDGV